MPDDPAKPPRFPYVAALLCVACVGMAGYLWMRYSFPWPLTAEELAQHQGVSFTDSWDGFYVSVRGAVSLPFRVRLYPLDPNCHEMPCVGMGECEPLKQGLVPEQWKCVGVLLPGGHRLVHRCPRRHGLPEDAEAITPSLPQPHIASVAGRVVIVVIGTRLPETYVDTTASRFTWHSITGLVVGAMGVFVFTVALRHWLGERRRFREGPEGA